MQACKKYKPTQPSLELHRRNPAGNCQSCVYFTKKNCGQHTTQVSELQGFS